MTERSSTVCHFLMDDLLLSNGVLLDIVLAEALSKLNEG